MKMTTDKDGLLDLLKSKEELLNRRVLSNYADAKKHLRLAVTKDGMADDVIYLAAKTYCKVYDMADEMNLIDNKLLNGEIEQIANDKLSVSSFFKQQENKIRLRKASDNFYDELRKAEQKKQEEDVDGYKVRDTQFTYRNKEKTTNDLKVTDKFKIRVGNHFISGKVVRKNGDEVFVTIKTNQHFADAKRIAKTVDDELRKFYDVVPDCVHYLVNREGTYMCESSGDEPSSVSYDDKSTPDDFVRERKLDVVAEKDPLVEIMGKAFNPDEEEIVCGNCHPDKLEEALKECGVDIHDTSIEVGSQFSAKNEDGYIYQAEVKKIRENADMPNIAYVDAWRGPAYSEEHNGDFLELVKQGIKLSHPGIAVLVKVVENRFW